MDRRKFLAHVSSASVTAAALAGQTAATKSNERTVTQKSGAVIDIDGVEATSELKQSTITSGKTARLALRLENTTQDAVSLEYDVPNQVNRIQGDHETTSAQAFMIGIANTWEPSGNQPFQASRELLQNKGRPTRTETVDLEPGGTYTMHYNLWANPGSDYFPTGVYEFSRSFMTNSKSVSLSFALDVQE